MLRQLFLSITVFFLIVNPGEARILNGLELSGSGEIRYLGFIKVYDASLYTLPSINVNELLGANSSLCLSLDYSVEVSSKDFIKAAETILEKQHSPEVLAPVRPQIDLLHSSYADVGKDDNYTLCYDASTRNATLSLNGKTLVTIPSAPDFATVYFGIWLGENRPIDANLRKELVSGLAEGESK